MNELFNDEFIDSKEIQKLIENVRNNLDLHESAEKFVKIVENKLLDQKEAFIPLLISFCDALREKGYPVMSDAFAEKWHMK